MASYRCFSLCKHEFESPIRSLLQCFQKKHLEMNSRLLSIMNIHQRHSRVKDNTLLRQDCTEPITQDRSQFSTAVNRQRSTGIDQLIAIEEAKGFQGLVVGSIGFLGQTRGFY